MATDSRTRTRTMPKMICGHPTTRLLDGERWGRAGGTGVSPVQPAPDRRDAGPTRKLVHFTRCNHTLRTFATCSMLSPEQLAGTSDKRCQCGYLASIMSIAGMPF